MPTTSLCDVETGAYLSGSSCAPVVVGAPGTRPKRGTVRFGVVCVKNAFGVRQVDVCGRGEIDKIRDLTAKFDHICGKAQ